MALTVYWAVNQVESPVDVQLRYNIRFASILMVAKLNIVSGQRINISISVQCFIELFINTLLKVLKC